MKEQVAEVLEGSSGSLALQHEEDEPRAEVLAGIGRESCRRIVVKGITGNNLMAEMAGTLLTVMKEVIIGQPREREA